MNNSVSTQGSQYCQRECGENKLAETLLKGQAGDSKRRNQVKQLALWERRSPDWFTKIQTLNISNVADR